MDIYLSFVLVEGKLSLIWYMGLPEVYMSQLAPSIKIEGLSL